MKDHRTPDRPESPRAPAPSIIALHFTTFFLVTESRGAQPSIEGSLDECLLAVLNFMREPGRRQAHITPSFGQRKNRTYGAKRWPEITQHAAEFLKRHGQAHSAWIRLKARAETQQLLFVRRAS